MNASHGTTAKKEKATSCGTLVLNTRGELLLCHATGTRNWDIPKGLQEHGETTLEAARRELREETGLEFDTSWFDEIGSFDYRPGKRLHLYKVQAPIGLDSLAHLRCSSDFPHRVTGELTPEVDRFCWASRSVIRAMCAPRMAETLLALDW